MLLRPILFRKLIQRPFLSLTLTSTNITRSMVSKLESEWQAILSPEQFRVLRQLGTERPGSGEYALNPATNTGVYECVGCQQPLYRSLTKFNAHCGWPAFYEAIPGSITVNKDKSLGMVREEMRCSNCNGHLGHIFRGEGHNNPTDERHCVNSVCLKFNDHSQ